MQKGYLVNSYPTLHEETVVNAYMAARERLFGYPQHPAQLHIPETNKDGIPVIRHKNAPPGLVETSDEAEALLDEMKRQFPSRTWTIEPLDFPDATSIDWCRSRPRP
jgi:hypothetical protein